MAIKQDKKKKCLKKDEKTTTYQQEKEEKVKIPRVKKQKTKKGVRLFCNVCYKSDSTSTFAHNEQVGCKVCDDCLDKWAAGKISDQIGNLGIKNVDDIQIGCPQCAQMIPINKVPSLPLIQEKLNLFYIKKHPQYISCPYSACKNIGWIDKSNCKQLTCTGCKNEWVRGNGASDGLNRFYFSELLTKLFKLFLTKNCPKCQAPIYKLGGCKKMRCSYCSHYFCWRCKGLGHYTFEFKCFFISLIQCLLVLLPFNYLLFSYGVYDNAYSQLSEFFTFQNIFYDYGFISIFPFIFRFVYKNGIAILLGINIFERNVGIVPRVLLGVDIVLWFIFTRWIEVLYYIIIIPQLILSLIVFFD